VHFVTYTMREVLFQIIWWYLQNVRTAYGNKYSGLMYKRIVTLLNLYALYKKLLCMYVCTSTSTKYNMSGGSSTYPMNKTCEFQCRAVIMNVK